MYWLKSLFSPLITVTRTTVIEPVTVSAGEDVVVSLPERLDSDDALALLDTLKQQFPATRIHLLTGFGDVQIQGNDRCSDCGCGDDRCDPPLPVSRPAIGKPASRLAEASEQGDVVVITYATSSHLIAVYVPPKQQGDSVNKAHFNPLRM
ncbi:hypothetical protein [Massilia antarctica]|uniref:hypothetical protein n=1 Tax=Massilia antarctica TaxID=2765360 RepID=UPI0022706F17|nr:hypothetical protein [Massilia sp. H27-R4]